ncbi:hypothetical protein [Vibrio crassostreae]|uniref:hypothetical protein n=1 Tax=Vibrio crassostreae TaxID=246167 RepID=UPI001B30D87A|nr:hypothetical protein [Vibrio crassostreae]
MSRVDLPQRILAEIPSKISAKIANQEPIDDSDQRVVRSYLDNTIVHPESVAENPVQLVSLLNFYMSVGAKINTHTVEYTRAHLNSEQLHKSLNEYDNITNDVKIILKKSPVTTTTFISFSTMNADKGFKTWNFYAENYNKLMKTLDRWVRVGAPYLMDNCEYSVYVEKQLLAKVEKGRDLKALLNQEVLDFITVNFGQPHEFEMVFKIERNKKNTFEFENLIIECGILNHDISQKVICALPDSDRLKVSLVKEKLIEWSKELVKEFRFKEGITSDISATVVANDVQVAVITYDGDSPSFVSNLDEVIADMLGVTLKKQELSKVVEEKVSWWKRLFGF